MKNKISANNVYAVILVGGKGKRLQPLSTEDRPKAFLSVSRDGRTMLQMTVERAKRLVPEKNIVIVANKAHARLVRRDFPEIKKNNLILEPVAKNTAPAIALASIILRKRDANATVIVLPVDQYIIGEEEYSLAIRDGVAFIKKNAGSIIVLAVRPIYPATGFGYLKIRTSCWQEGTKGLKDICKIEKFIEKPDLKTAEKFFNDGGYLWNAGGFIFKAKTMLDRFEKLEPCIFDAFKDFDKISLDDIYENLPDISIDYAIMEKSGGMYCVEGHYIWRDMGSFESVKEILRRETRKFIEKDGKITRIL